MRASRVNPTCVDRYGPWRSRSAAVPDQQCHSASKTRVTALMASLRYALHRVRDTQHERRLRFAGEGFPARGPTMRSVCKLHVSNRLSRPLLHHHEDPLWVIHIGPKRGDAPWPFRYGRLIIEQVSDYQTTVAKGPRSVAPFWSDVNDP